MKSIRSWEFKVVVFHFVFTQIFISRWSIKAVKNPRGTLLYQYRRCSLCMEKWVERMWNLKALTCVEDSRCSAP
jgi:hypothetical protein